MKQHFENMRALLQQVAIMRQTYKADLAKLDSQKGTFADEYLAQKKAEVSKNMAAHNQDFYLKAVQMINDFTTAAIEKQRQWPNLADPKLSNALKIVELSKGSLDSDGVREIVKQFEGDTPSLKALQQILKAQNIPFDGGIERMLYDPEAAGETLSEYARNVFYENGSLNSFGTAIGKIATREGVPFDGMVDPAGFDAAVRESAGLPE